MIANTNSTATSSKKDAHCLGCFGVSLGFAFVVGLVGVMIYNLIKSIIAVISFTHNDVEKVCPNSDLWWFALFVGVIWPILGSNGARNAANSQSDTEDPIIVGSCTVFTYITLLTTFSLWAWDQLWGIKGFANDQCAMNHWANKNTTDLEILMNQSPGVQVVDGQANIRGGSGWSYNTGSRVLVMVDDMPLLSGDRGTVEWDMIPMENVSQIEVIKGASSVLFGSTNIF